MDYRFLFIGLSVAYLLYKIVIEYLSLKSTRNKIPSSLEGIYDNNDYLKFQSYSKEKNIFNIVHNIIILGVDLGVFLSPLLPYLDSLIQNQFLSSLVLICVYLLIEAIFELPFKYYSTFKIEEKYGFNKTNSKTFISDQIKDFLISIALMYGINAIYIAIYTSLGLYSIAVIIGVLTLLYILINFLAPLLVSFRYKKTPLEDGKLKASLESLLSSEGYTVKGIYVIDGSKRSTKANAFFTGIGKLKSIMLYDTLIDILTPEEICAVFAHEMGHGKNKDSLRNIITSFIRIAFIIVGLILITHYVDIYTSFGYQTKSFGFIFLILGESILPIFMSVFGILSSHLSRKHEYKADKMAKDKGYGEDLISSLKKLAKNNYSNLTPNSFVVKATYSHPPVGDRINAIRNSK